MAKLLSLLKQLLNFCFVLCKRCSFSISLTRLEGLANRCHGNVFVQAEMLEQHFDCKPLE